MLLEFARVSSDRSRDRPADRPPHETVAFSGRWKVDTLAEAKKGSKLLVL